MTQNIYAPPKSDVQLESVAVEGELAGRGTRLGAAIIDSLIGLIFTIPFIIFAGPTLGYSFGQQTQPGLTYIIVSSIYGFFIFTLIHGYFLQRNGQTIGKKLLGIKIVMKTDTPASLGRILGLRYLPISLVPIIPVIGMFIPLLDILFIFRKDRRCLHDFVASTRVIKCVND